MEELFYPKNDLPTGFSIEIGQHSFIYSETKINTVLYLCIEVIIKITVVIKEKEANDFRSGIYDSH